MDRSLVLRALRLFDVVLIAQCDSLFLQLDLHVLMVKKIIFFFTGSIF